MIVKMRRKMRGSPNGIIVRQYEGGETYDSEDGFITERLCRVFVGANVADEVETAEPTAPRHPVESEEKKIVEPEETKGEIGPESPQGPEGEPGQVTVDEFERSGSWYILPNGEKVNGRDAAEAALAAL